MAIKAPKSWRDLRAMDLEIAKKVLGWKTTFKTRTSMKTYEMGDVKRMYRLADAKGHFVGLHTELSWADDREYVWYDTEADVWSECCPRFTAKIEHAWPLVEKFRISLVPGPHKTWKAILPYGSAQNSNVCLAICIALLRNRAGGHKWVLKGTDVIYQGPSFPGDKPLSPKTVARIQAGMKKFCGEPHVRKDQ